MGKCFPLFVEIEGREIAVFGGSGHAVAKINRFVSLGARVTVVAPFFDGVLSAPIAEGKFEAVLGDFEKFMAVLATKTPVLVYALLEDEAACQRLLTYCRVAGIPLHVEDRSPYCTCTFPSIISRGSLTVGICTGGASPTVAKKLREEIEPLLPEATEEILAWLQAIRPEIQQNAALTPRQRTKLWRRLADAAFAENRTLAPDEVRVLLAEILQE